MLYEYSRHIVRRTLRLGKRNEIVEFFLCALIRAHDVADLLVRRRDDQTVRAEQDLVTVRERNIECVAERRFVGTKRAGDEVAVGMRARLLGGDVAIPRASAPRCDRA